MLSLPLGLVLALLRISRFGVVSGAFKRLHLADARHPLGTADAVHLFRAALRAGDRHQAADFPAAIVAFVLNYAAYFAEIFRAGIQSIGRGQYEAARVLGMTYTQTMRRIVLPQMIKRILPPVSNETITLVKAPR